MGYLKLCIILTRHFNNVLSRITL